eukprot:CAMPEP_0182416254 /NCGR_PEP_ID=MMETSP1167-20130531/502_1 /TAXON_ID=2988 /ORGANISM="Mallomonas Sp, Strain CCMP3275" /LENGTH=385 /DNA_ID=CAMNT_0024588865 /DNA_START=208 /DNA_END=1365 /DNA_ORIENTATION=+
MKCAMTVHTESDNSSSSMTSGSSPCHRPPNKDLNGRWSLKSGSYAKNLAEVDIIKTIGSGRFGFTHIVHCRISKKHVFMNLYQKSVLTDTCQQHIPSREKEILSSLSHPFISKCLGAFQNNSCLYMLLELPRAGDLSRLLMSSTASSQVLQKPLTEKQKMFYAASVLSVFKYIHSRNIIYRGLHPDTILIDDYGQIKLVDWGFAKEVPDYTFTFCGHVEYLCPEAIVYDTGYGRGADYWALGILIYEMLAGRSAFVMTSSLNDSDGTMSTDIDDTNTVENIITKDIEFPSYFSESASSLIEGLCQKNPAMRLGCVKNGRGIVDIMCHPWFSGMDWEKLDQREISPPWLPQQESVLSLRYFGGEYVQESALHPFDGYNHIEWNAFN